MCDDEGTRGGDGSAKAARCGSGGKGRGRLCQWGTVDDKVGEDDERDAGESSPQHGRRLRGSNVTGWKESGRKEKGGLRLEGRQWERRRRGRGDDGRR